MILVTGAKGVVGGPLCERLSYEKIEHLTVSRQVSNSSSQLQWNLSDAPSKTAIKSLESVTSLIHCAPIWLLPPHLNLFETLGVRQLVVFSSTSVLSKRGSKDKGEQHLVNQLAQAEKSLFEFCERKNVSLCILRPTLIYGYFRDENVSHIAKFIRRYGFMVLVGNATGLRQPVHADDLVNAALRCLNSPTDIKLSYNLAGKDVLSYRNMVKQIFIGLNRRPMIISIPLWLFRPALIIAAKIGRFSYTPEMATRMNLNLNYDYTDAANDIGFSPQGFLNLRNEICANDIH